MVNRFKPFFFPWGLGPGGCPWEGGIVVVVCGGAGAVTLSLAILMLGGADVDEAWGAADDAADCCLACLRFRAAVSRGSSTVLNWAQVRSRNCRINWPNSVVNSSSKSKVLSQCIRSLARACHSAVRYRSFMRRLLWGSSRRPSNEGSAHYEWLNNEFKKPKIEDKVLPAEGPQSHVLPISSFLMNLLQRYEWYHVQKLKSIYNYSSMGLVWMLPLQLKLKFTVCQAQPQCHLSHGLLHEVDE